MRFAAGVALVALALTGCAGFSSSKNRPPQAEWRVGKFEVAFYPGPRAAGQDRTYSYYSVRSLSQDDLSLEVVESAYRERTDRDPKDSIRVIGDSTGDRVLIRESVPNDASPCVNYALISADADGEIHHTFLRIPGKWFDPGEFEEYPQIESIDGGVLKLRYLNGSKEQRRIDEIEKASRPEQPG